MKHILKKFFLIVLLILFSACGIKKFPTIPFIKGAPDIKKVDFKIKNGQVTLFWDNLKDNDIKFYDIYMSKAPVGVKYCLKCDENFEQIDKLDYVNFEDEKTVSINIENLENNFKYCYAVVAEIKNGKKGDFSNKVCFQWFYKDNIIYNIKALPQDRSVMISWNKSKIPEIILKGVNIYQKDKNNNYSLICTESGKNFYIVKNLKNGRKYTFYVAPLYKYQNTLIEGKLFTVSAVPEDLTPPELPQVFTGYFTNGGIYLKWARSVSDDIYGYDIIRKKEGEKYYKQINDSIIKKEYFFDSHVEKGKVYYYKIRAIDKNFNPSKFSKPIKVIAE